MAKLHGAEKITFLETCTFEHVQHSKITINIESLYFSEILSLSDNNIVRYFNCRKENLGQTKKSFVKNLYQNLSLKL